MGYKDGSKIEIRFSGIWYPATVIQARTHTIAYRLDQEAKRRTCRRHYLFGLLKRFDFFTYPEGYEGQIGRLSPNVRLAEPQTALTETA